MSSIDNLITKSTQLTSLLIEFKQSETNNKFNYLVKLESENLHSLYDNKNNKLIMLDKLSRIKSWLNIRNITNVNFL